MSDTITVESGIFLITISPFTNGLLEKRYEWKLGVNGAIVKAGTTTTQKTAIKHAKNGIFLFYGEIGKQMDKVLNKLEDIENKQGK